MVVEARYVAIVEHTPDGSAEIVIPIRCLCKFVSFIPKLHVTLSRSVDVAFVHNQSTAFQRVGMDVVATVVAHQRDPLAAWGMIDKPAREGLIVYQILSGVHLEGTSTINRIDLVVDPLRALLNFASCVWGGDHFRCQQKLMNQIVTEYQDGFPSVTASQNHRPAR